MAFIKIGLYTIQKPGKIAEVFSENVCLVKNVTFTGSVEDQGTVKYSYSQENVDSV